jgi:hypothetical protein
MRLGIEASNKRVMIGKRSRLVAINWRNIIVSSIAYLLPETTAPYTRRARLHAPYVTVLVNSLDLDNLLVDHLLKSLPESLQTHLSRYCKLAPVPNK